MNSLCFKDAIMNDKIDPEIEAFIREKKDYMSSYKKPSPQTAKKEAIKEPEIKIEDHEEEIQAYIHRNSFKVICSIVSTSFSTLIDSIKKLFR